VGGERRFLNKDHKQNRVLRFYIENYCKRISIINRLNAGILRQKDLLQKCAVTVVLRMMIKYEIFKPEPCDRHGKFTYNSDT
jgi:hypothetical protein